VSTIGVEVLEDHEALVEGYEVAINLLVEDHLKQRY
jgi:hypothetical protein